MPWLQVDNKFTVPDGYLSDDERETDENERFLLPTTTKQQINQKEGRLEKEVNEKIRAMKPSLIGCCWENSGIQVDVSQTKVLKQHEAVLLTAASFPVQVLQDKLQIDEEKAIVAGKRLVRETDIPVLIKYLHGSKCKESTMKEFLAHLERIRPQDKNSKLKLIF